jgi:hypothetical protein
MIARRPPGLSAASRLAFELVRICQMMVDVTQEYRVTTFAGKIGRRLSALQYHNIRRSVLRDGVSDLGELLRSEICGVDASTWSNPLRHHDGSPRLLRRRRPRSFRASARAALPAVELREPPALAPGVQRQRVAAMLALLEGRTEGRLCVRSGVATSSFHLGPIVQTSNMTPQRPIEFTNADSIRGYGADDMGRQK